jgi:hypothetical protein
VLKLFKLSASTFFLKIMNANFKYRVDDEEVFSQAKKACELYNFVYIFLNLKVTKLKYIYSLFLVFPIICEFLENFFF